MVVLVFFIYFSIWRKLGCDVKYVVAVVVVVEVFFL